MTTDQEAFVNEMLQNPVEQILSGILSSTRATCVTPSCRRISWPAEEQGFGVTNSDTVDPLRRINCVGSIVWAQFPGMRCSIWFSTVIHPRENLNIAYWRIDVCFHVPAPHPCTAWRDFSTSKRGPTFEEDLSLQDSRDIDVCFPWQYRIAKASILWFDCLKEDMAATA